jgi:hypothetical protein
MMVIAITMAAMIQPAAIHRPPKMIHSRFRRTEMGDIPGVILASFSATMTLTPSLAGQLRGVDCLTGFSSISLPCFSTKAFALFASIESSHGSCTSSLT